MSTTMYYALGAIATVAALLLTWLMNVPNLNNPVTYLYIGFLLCLQVMYHLRRRQVAQRPRGKV